MHCVPRSLYQNSPSLAQIVEQRDRGGRMQLGTCSKMTPTSVARSHNSDFTSFDNCIRRASLVARATRDVYESR